MQKENNYSRDDKKHSHIKSHISSTFLGRKGDPRMHKAVAARIANPSLSPYEALRAGGFEYHGDDSSSLDFENIMLSQRKNQLSRRLRLAKNLGEPTLTSSQSNSPASKGNIMSFDSNNAMTNDLFYHVFKDHIPEFLMRDNMVSIGKYELATIENQHEAKKNRKLTIIVV